MTEKVVRDRKRCSSCVTGTGKALRLLHRSSCVLRTGTLQCVAVCCIVLQCVAVCCSVLLCVAVCYSGLQFDAVCLHREF